MSDKYLIVGLGNPGRKYEKTRHNAGFHVVDALAARWNLRGARDERKARVIDGLHRGSKVILAKPQTYMNLSGESVRALVDFYKVDPLQRLIVIYDDLDIDLGVLRLRKNGGAGGQNGVRSIIQHLGTRDFDRMRFGIGRPPGRMAAKDYVLQPFMGDDVILAQEVVDRACAALELWLVEGMEAAMSAYNGDVNEPVRKSVSVEEELVAAQRAHELKPDDPKPIARMASILMRLERSEEAVQRHLEAAAIYEEQGNTTRFIAHMEQAVRLKPQLIEVQSAIARAYEAVNNNKKAVDRYLRLATHHIAHGDSPAAARAVTEALRVNPQHPKALTMQAELRQS